MYYKNQLIIGAVIKAVFRFIGKILTLIWKAVYSVIRFFHLLPIIIFTAIGLLGELLFGMVTYNDLTFAAYHLVGILLILYSVIMTLAGTSLSKKNKKKKSNKNEKTSGLKIKSAKKSIDKKPPESEAAVSAKTEKSQEEKTADTVNSGYPVYYRVKQNPNYIMAEYEDRYELYYENENGLKYVRTDDKANGRK